MNNLDDELRDALRRVQPPSGFAARVIARAHEQAPAHQRLWSAPVLRWAVAATVLIAVGLGGFEYRRDRRERAQGEAARQQAIIALRIAGTKLKLAQAKVQRLSAPQSRATTN